MPEFFNVNPFAEAMLYYGGIANDASAEKRAAGLMKLQPDNKEKLGKILKPVIRLEAYLNSSLNADSKLVDKYFKVFSGSKTKFPFGFCLAAMMVLYPLMEHIEYSPDEFCTYLRSCSMKDYTFSFVFSLANSCETVMPDEIGPKEVLKRLEKSNLDTNDKWRLLQAAYDYPTHIEELLSIITPAVKLIKSRRSLYDPLIEEFYEFYSDEDVEKELSSDFNKELKFAGLVMAAPSLFGFEGSISIFPNKFTPASDRNDSENNENGIDNENSINNENSKNNGNGEKTSDTEKQEMLPPAAARMFIGIARHLISRSPHNEIVGLSKKIQTLSDVTRLEILFYLCSHREYGRMLCKKFGIQHSTLSYHITKLLSGGFITAETSGTQTFYTADKEGIQRFIETFAKKVK